MASLAQVLVAIAMLLALPAGAYVTGAMIGPPPRAVDPPEGSPAQASVADGDHAPAARSGRRATGTSTALGAPGAAETSAPEDTFGAAAPTPGHDARPARGRSGPAVDRADPEAAGKTGGPATGRERRGGNDALPSPAWAAGAALPEQADRPEQAARSARPASGRSASGRTAPNAPEAADVVPGARSVPRPSTGRGPS